MATRDVVCPDCQTTFTTEVGYRKKAHTYCRPCAAERVRAANRRKQYAWRAKNPERWKAATDRHNAKRLADPEHLRRKRENEARRVYGIEPHELQAMTEAQGGVCAICGAGPGRIGRRGMMGRLHIDHCHATGQVRGLLCGNCNTMIGLAREDTEIMQRAIQYLRGGE